METVRCDFKCSVMVARQFIKLMKQLEKKEVIHDFDEWGFSRFGPTEEAVQQVEDNNP